jgi:hypothetical protein
MHSQSRHDISPPNTGYSWRIITLMVALTSGLSEAWAADLYSAHVDREAQKIILKGSGFGQSTTVTLGGVAVVKGNITNLELEIPFADEVYSAVQWEASYNLVVDDTNRISVYIDSPILSPPPPGGLDCPCIADWEAAGLAPSSLSCSDGIDGTQTFVFGIGGNTIISAAFDPNNIFFDENNPGNSLSFCALSQNNIYTVAEPVVNQEQYLDCADWIRVRSTICLF